jgi:flagellar biosynthesis GTPase FlhF
MTSITQTSARGSLRRSLSAMGLGAVLMTALSGCFAHASGEVVYEYPAEYVEPPPRVEFYPHVSYRGSPAYLVEGRWYYQTRNRWVTFRDEPAELRDYRVRQAPAYLAPHRDPHGRRSERLVAERRSDQRRHEERQRHEAQQQRRVEEHRRAEERHAEERRRNDERQRAEQFRRAEEHRQQERQRHAEQQRQRFDEQRRAAQERAANERRESDRRGRHARGRDRPDEDQDERAGHKDRDRRRSRQD